MNRIQHLFLMVVSVGVLLLPGSAVPAGLLDGFVVPAKNFVQNGDFASGMEPNWHFFHTPSGEGSSGIVNEGQDGGPCFKISGRFNDDVLVEQLFMPGKTSLEPGQTYTFSAWLKAQNITGTDPAKVLFLANFGWHGDSAMLGLSAATTPGWERRSVTFIAPPTTFPPDSYKYMLIFYWPKGSQGTLWMDDVQIERGPAVTAFDVRHNDTIRLLVNDLKQFDERLLLQRKNMTERFAKSPLAGGIDTKLVQYSTEAQRLGAELLDYGKLSAVRIREIAQQVAAIKAAIGGLTCLVWYKNPYIASDETDFPPDLKPPAPRKLVCAVNETRNLGLMLSNLGGHSLNYRVAPQRFKRAADGMEVDGQAFITFYEAPLIRGQLHKDQLFTDPLPRCNAMNALCVPGGETRQIVLSINTRALDPGTYKGAVFLGALNNREALSQSIPLELEVLPVRLPDRVPVDICPLGTQILRPEEALRLGHNLLPLDGGAIPISLDTNGNLTRPPELDGFDWQVRESRKIVPDCKYVLTFSLGACFVAETERRYGFRWPEERLKRGWQNWISGIFAHAKMLGVSTNDLYLQVVDEPQGSEVEMMAELSRLAKEAVPGLKTMTYGGNPRQHAALFKYLDMPCPGSVALADPALLAGIKALGLKPGMYDCHEYNEIMVPLLYRRLMPWKVWKYDLCGLSYWYRDDRQGPNWNAVKFMSVLYPLADGEFGRVLTADMDYVISRHWLAMEAGVQDYKSLLVLKRALEQARRESSANQALMLKATAFLSSAPDSVLALIDPAHFPNAMAAGADPDLVDRLREEATQLTAQLLATSNAELITRCTLSGKGRLTLAANAPCCFRVCYVVDGQLPFREMEVTTAARKHQVVLDKFGGAVISKCRIQVCTDDGRMQLVSPLIDGRLTVDSVFPEYESSCLTDGIRYPGAQYWPGKTWISQSTPVEHWVQLDWGKPQAISTVLVCWMTRGGLPEARKVQCLIDKTWSDVTAWQRPSAAFDVVRFKPVKATAVRVVQKAGGGNTATPNMMGVSEIEVLNFRPNFGCTR